MKTSTVRTAVLAGVLIAFLLSTLFSITSATAPQQSVIIKNCGQSQRTYDLRNLPDNCRWYIELRKNGYVVGAIAGQTLSDLMEQKNGLFEECRKWDERYNDHICASYGTPGEPICSVCAPPMRTTEVQAANNAIAVYDDWLTRVRRMRDKLLRDEVLSALHQNRISVSGPGSVLRDYTTALNKASEELQLLLQSLLHTERTGRDVMAAVEAATRVDQAGQRAEAEFRALPRHIQNAISRTEEWSAPQARPRQVPKPPQQDTRQPKSCDEEVPRPNGRWSMLGCYQKCCGLLDAAYERCQAEQEIWNQKLKACEAKRRGN